MTDRQELILQMFAEDKSLSIGILCENTGLPGTTAKREIAFRTNPLITAQVRLRPKFRKLDIVGICRTGCVTSLIAYAAGRC